jgi:hypothetical protein
VPHRRRLHPSYVAELFGEDENWLHDLSIDMFPEDGCLHVYTSADKTVNAFTDYRIEYLKQIIAAGRASPHTFNEVRFPGCAIGCLSKSRPLAASTPH